MIDFEYFLETLGTISKGIPNTFMISILALAVALLIGTVTGIITYQKVPILYQIAQAYISIFRSTPAIAQLFLFYYGVGAVSMIVNRMNPLIAAAFILSMNSGAYISETIRGGLLSVDSGQIEAGKALGLSNRKIMNKIILPQAFPIAIPSLFGNFINIVKGTSITFMIGVPDIMGIARTEGAISFRYLEVYLGVIVVYWLIVNILSTIFNVIIKKMNLSKK